MELVKEWTVQPLGCNYCLWHGISFGPNQIIVAVEPLPLDRGQITGSLWSADLNHLAVFRLMLTAALAHLELAELHQLSSKESLVQFFMEVEKRAGGSSNLLRSVRTKLGQEPPDPRTSLALEAAILELSRKSINCESLLAAVMEPIPDEESQV